MKKYIVLLGSSLLALSACQSYDFLFEPDADRQAVHLRFLVQQPSKADLLFVIDNSVSMAEEQQALEDSIDRLLEVLGPQDTRYRIGIISTDTVGKDVDCSGSDEAAFLGENFPASQGNCARFEEEDPDDGDADAVVLRRPHDGARGRLIAAYDPDVFDLDDPDNTLLENEDGTERLSEANRAALARVLPTSATTHPADPEAYDFEDFPGFKGEQGARWVIDREIIRLEACQACECYVGDGASLSCDEDSSCYADCVQQIAPIMVEAYFRANVAGLGISGQGWEQGLKASGLAVGVDVEEQNDEVALNPQDNLIALPDGYNTFNARSTLGGAEKAPWVRDEALLAVMYVSDEEDCSMPPEVWEYRCRYEEGCEDTWSPPPGWEAQPEGSLCYQRDAELISTERVSHLMLQRKGGSRSRLAIGFIGGAQQVSGQHSRGEAVDCSQAIDPATEQPSTECSCLNHSWNLADAGQLWSCNMWCSYTRNDLGACIEPPNPPYCDALAGSRYVDFAKRFSRRTFDSVCKAEAGEGFGEAMGRFGEIATRACFELEGVDDVAGAGLPDPDDIVVMRATKEEAEQGVAPALLPRRDSSAEEAGWYFEANARSEDPPAICLTGIDRLIGDVYDIYLLTRDDLDFTR